MFYYIYKTTNTVNGKYYLGMHQSKKAFDPSYLGSGVGLSAAIKKYGRDAFTCSVIEYCETREQMIEREKHFVTEEVVRDNNSYNRNIGGKGGSLPGRGTGGSLPGTGRGGSKKGSTLLRNEHTGEVRRFSLTELEDVDRNVWVGANRGGTHSPDQREAMRVRSLKRTQTESCKELLRERNKNRKWYNNGTVQTFADQCPEGYKPGMLKRVKAV